MGRLASVAIGDTPDEIISAAVQASREHLGIDAAFAAVDTSADGYAMSALAGVNNERIFRQLVVQSGRGLGGRVLVEGHPMWLPSYPAADNISDHYKPILAADRLQAVACVPVVGPDGYVCLLYAASRAEENFGDRFLAELERIGDYTSVGLHSLASRKQELELERLRDRERIATRVHDSVAQLLFGIGVLARQSREEVNPDVLTERMAEIEATSADARRELREALSSLSQFPEEVSFLAVFDAEVRVWQRSTGRQAYITRSGEPCVMAPAVEELLIDTLREGLRNADKHTRAGLAVVHLGFEQDRVVLAIQTERPNAYAGETADRAAVLVPGSGLWALRERVRRLRGELELAIREELAALRVELPAAAAGA
ncbi:MAG: GAF domain-containing protein [Solirubrobacterales bacterium]|nr:GAF domain-containing protein [Solirubrobacterales bacterium]